MNLYLASLMGGRHVASFLVDQSWELMRPQRTDCLILRRAAHPFIAASASHIATRAAENPRRERRGRDSR